MALCTAAREMGIKTTDKTAVMTEVLQILLVPQLHLRGEKCPSGKRICAKDHLQIWCRVELGLWLHPLGSQADPGREKIIPEIISDLFLIPEHGWH